MINTKAYIMNQVKNIQTKIIHKALYMRYYFFIIYLISTVLVLSCAGRGKIESYQPILGSWETERGIIMSIKMTPNKGAKASVEISPGFDIKNIQHGDALITNIKPLVDGGYTGILGIPDGLKPVKVKLGLISRDTLLIMTWDKRAKNKVMRWKRVLKSPEE